MGAPNVALNTDTVHRPHPHDPYAILEVVDYDAVASVADRVAVLRRVRREVIRRGGDHRTMRAVAGVLGPLWGRGYSRLVRAGLRVRVRPSRLAVEATRLELRAHARRGAFAAIDRAIAATSSR